MSMTDVGADADPDPQVPVAPNLTVALAYHAEQRPEVRALELGARVFSYSELDAAVWRSARWLQRQGVTPGQVVALRLREPVALACALLGLMRLGATPMPLSPSATAAQVRELVEEARARWMLVDPGEIQHQACEALPFSEQRLLAHDAAPEVAWLSTAPQVPCVLITGSGTTGQPRLMPVTHAQMQMRAAMLRQLYSLRCGDRLMVVSPLHFATPCYRILAALVTGATGIVWDQHGGLGAAVASASPDVVHLSVFHAEQLLSEHNRGWRVDLSSIRVVSIGASSISEALRARLRGDLNACLHINYGTNEAFTVAYAYPQDLNAAAGVVGRPPPGVDVEIVDATGHPLKEGAIGQVRVRSPAQISGYLHGSDADRFRDGWFYPGDLAQWAPDGQLIHCGRADQMMIMNGINIYPAEIERVLALHPAVREVVAFPLQHPIAQDMPVCAVVLHEGTVASRKELQDFAQNRLGSRAPRVVVVLEAIARNEQGKAVRAELTRRVAAALGSRDVPVSTPATAPLAGVPSAMVGPQGRQRMQRLGVNFIAPRDARAELLRAWATRLGCAETDAGVPSLLVPPGGGAAFSVISWLQEVLRVARALLLAVRVPAFAQPRISALTQGAGGEVDAGSRWHAEVELPVLDQFAPQTWELALGSALRIAAWVHGQPSLRPADDSACDTFFEWVEQQALTPLRRLASQGKSTLHVLRACYQHGVPFRHLGGGIYQLGWGARARRIDRSSTGHDSAIGPALTRSKPLTAAVLRAAGLPGAVHEVVRTVEAARAAAGRLGWPVVVKPADAERGEGVQVDVGPEALVPAFTQARNCSPSAQVLVERQVRGVCHRLFVARGQLLYAVKRLPIGVYGDGQRNVAQLVEAVSARERRNPPWQRSPVPCIDDSGLAMLVRAGFDATSVPQAGHFVPLRSIETTAWGGVDEDVTSLVHPENVRAAVAASALCGLDVAGVDFISLDICQPWHRNGAVINEVNYAPLLGGGEISRRHVPEFLGRLLDGDGRIPVEVYVGDEQAAAAARARAVTLHRQGLAVAVSSHNWTHVADGQELALSVSGLDARARALVLLQTLDALLLVVQNDELLESGLPLEGVDAVHMVNTALASRRPEQASQRLRRILRMLRGWTWPRARAERGVAGDA